MPELYNPNDAPENYTDEDLIEACLLQSASEGNESHEWAFSELVDLVHEQPERAWQIILALTDRARDPDSVALIAAGPMEDLLSEHGPAFIARVEERAAADPKFNHMLGGVWRLEMTQDVRSRLNKARKEIW